MDLFPVDVVPPVVIIDDVRHTLMDIVEATMREVFWSFEKTPRVYTVLNSWGIRILNSGT